MLCRSTANVAVTIPQESHCYVRIKIFLATNGQADFDIAVTGEIGGNAEAAGRTLRDRNACAGAMRSQEAVLYPCRTHRQKTGGEIFVVHAFDDLVDVFGKANSVVWSAKRKGRSTLENAGNEA